MYKQKPHLGLNKSWLDIFVHCTRREAMAKDRPNFSLTLFLLEFSNGEVLPVFGPVSLEHRDPEQQVNLDAHP